MEKLCWWPSLLCDSLTRTAAFVLYLPQSDVFNHDNFYITSRWHGICRHHMHGDEI